MTSETNPFARLVIAQTIQNFIDDPYFLWEGGCTDDELDHLKEYLKKKGIPVPVLPKDKVRAESAKKAIYLVWAALECNGSICELMGVEP